MSKATLTSKEARARLKLATAAREKAAGWMLSANMVWEAKKVELTRADVEAAEFTAEVERAEAVEALAEAHVLWAEANEKALAESKAK